MLGLCVLVVVFAFMANAASGLVPPLRDEVTLTALGEKREEASAAEVYLTGYTIDGKEYLAGKDMKILDGKWFWKGDTYCWRIETDTRQPEGVTRTITVGIPVGWQRTLNFEGSVWRGLVEISTGTDTWTADTYSEEKSPVSVPVGRSATSSLIWDQILHLAVYALILLGLSAAVGVLALPGARPVKRRLAAFIRDHYDVLIYIGLACFMLLAMRFYHRFNDMFWGDDLANVNIIAYDTLLQAIERNLQLRDITPPLFNLIGFYAAKLLPHSFSGLLWIPQTYLAISVVVMGLLGRKVFGKPQGILAAIVTATSSSLILCTGYEFRGYSMYFMFSALTMLVYAGRLESRTVSGKRLLALTGCYTALLFSHYFGFMIVGIYFLGDLWLCVRKKYSYKCIAAYFVSGFLFLGWILAVFLTENSFAFTNPTPPDITDVLDVLTFFLNGSKLLLALFVFAVAWLVVFRKKAGGNEGGWKGRFLLALTLAIPASNVLAVYIYSQSSSVFRSRYLVSLMPYIYLIAVFGFKQIADRIRHGAADRPRAMAVMLISVFLLLSYEMNGILLNDMGAKGSKIIVEQNNQCSPQLSALRALEKKEDLSYQTTGVYFTWNTDAFRYLFEGDGYYDVNVENYNDAASMEKYDTIYYFYYHWGAVNYMEKYNIIPDDFEVAEEDTNLKIIKYVRKKS